MKSGELRRFLVAVAVAAAMLVVAGTAANAQSSSSPDYVSIAKRVMMKSLDSTAANVPFERWLADLARVDASAITWELNDCGEGGDGNKAPTCVEAQFKLRGDSVASASLVVADLEGKRGQPEIWSLLIGDGRRFTEVKPLAAWVAAVRTMRTGQPRD